MRNYCLNSTLRDVSLKLHQFKIQYIVIKHFHFMQKKLCGEVLLLKAFKSTSKRELINVS